jgi:uncharacterized membrane protein YgdD (TMEM256/DUF423 family)
MVHSAHSQAYRWWCVLGCLNAALAVAMGALGAHAFKELLSHQQSQDWFNLALQFHQWHALGLIAVGVLARLLSVQKMLHCAGVLMLVGIVLFCGLLYLRSLGIRGAWHGLIPIGGSALILAWLVLALAIWSGTRE